MSVKGINKKNKSGRLAELKKEMDSLKSSAKAGNMFAHFELNRVARVYCNLRERRERQKCQRIKS